MGCVVDVNNPSWREYPRKPVIKDLKKEARTKEARPKKNKWE